MKSTSRPALESIADVLTVDVAAAIRVVVAGDLRLPRQPTADSLAVASEFGAALDAWVGPGVLVFNGGVFDLADDPAAHPRRILDAHPRLSAALDRFTSGDSRRVVFLVGTGHDGCDRRSPAADVGPRRCASHHHGRGRAPRLSSPAPVRSPTTTRRSGCRASHRERMRRTGHRDHVRPELTRSADGGSQHGSGGIVVRPRSRRWGLPSVQVGRNDRSRGSSSRPVPTSTCAFCTRRVDVSDRSLGERITSRPGPEPVPKPRGGVRVPRRQRLARPRVTPTSAAAGRVGRPRGARGGRRGEPSVGRHTSPAGSPRHPPRPRSPIAVPETASALVAAAGIALLGLSWGVRYGQRHAWTLAVGITALSVVLHIVKGLDVEEAVGRGRGARLSRRQATSIHRGRRTSVDGRALVTICRRRGDRRPRRHGHRALARSTYRVCRSGGP